MSGPVQISGGRYPLIQTPSPFQQLAETLQGIQAQRAARAQEAAKNEALQAEIALRNAEADQANAGAGQKRAETRAITQKAEDEAETQHQVQMAWAPVAQALAGGLSPSDPIVSRLRARSEAVLSKPEARNLFHRNFDQATQDYFGATNAQNATKLAALNTAAEALKNDTAQHLHSLAQTWEAQNPVDAPIAAAGPGAVSLTNSERQQRAENLRHRQTLDAQVPKTPPVTAEDQATALVNARAAVTQMRQSLGQVQQADGSWSAPTNPQAGSQSPWAVIGAGLVARHTSPEGGEAARAFLSSDPQVMFRGATQQFAHNLSSVLPRGSRSKTLFDSFTQGYTAPPGKPELSLAFVNAADAALSRAERAHTLMRGAPLPDIEAPELSAFGAVTGAPGASGQQTVTPLTPGSLADPAQMLAQPLSRPTP